MDEKQIDELLDKSYNAAALERFGNDAIKDRLSELSNDENMINADELHSFFLGESMDFTKEFIRQILIKSDF